MMARHLGRFCSQVLAVRGKFRVVPGQAAVSLARLMVWVTCRSRVSGGWRISGGAGGRSAAMSGRSRRLWSLV